MRKLIYYVAATIDGFIAAPDGGVDHFPVEPDLIEFISAEYPETLPAPARTAIGLDAPNRAFDTVLMGRATYEPALQLGITSPYPQLRQYVFSRSPSASASASASAAPEPEVEIVSGDPVDLVRRLKQQQGRDIWLCGGGDLAGQVFPEIDELVIKLNPVVCGSGVALVSRQFDPARFTLASARPLPSGVVILRYTR